MRHTSKIHDLMEMTHGVCWFFLGESFCAKCSANIKYVYYTNNAIYLFWSSEWITVLTLQDGDHGQGKEQ